MDFIIKFLSFIHRFGSNLIFSFVESNERYASHEVSAFGKDCVVVPVMQIAQATIVVLSEVFLIVVIACVAINSI